VLILIAVGSMAGAASFTHVHDWPMTHAPAGTPGWFGWGNAVISELTPLAAGLEIRRRKRHSAPIGYPMCVLVAAALLSLSAQVAVANASPSGWLLFAVPALAFLALTKMVLSRTAATPARAVAAEHIDAAATERRPSPSSAERDNEPATAPTGTPIPFPRIDRGETVDALPAHLIGGARFAATNHRQTTGQRITAAELAARMNLTPATAGDLLAALDETTPDATRPARINGTPVPAGEAR
jgi:hypothetical protein